MAKLKKVLSGNREHESEKSREWTDKREEVAEEPEWVPTQDVARGFSVWRRLRS